MVSHVFQHGEQHGTQGDEDDRPVREDDRRQGGSDRTRTACERAKPARGKPAKGKAKSAAKSKRATVLDPALSPEIDDAGDEWTPPTHSRSGRRLKPSERARYTPPTAVSVRAITTAEKKAAIIEALATGLSVGGACRKAGASRNSYYDWKNADPDFEAAIAEAFEDGCDSLEDAMHADAMEPGNFLARVSLLKARRPQAWRDNAKPVEINIIQPGVEFKNKFDKFAEMVTGRYVETLDLTPSEPAKLFDPKDVEAPAAQAPRIAAPIIDVQASDVEPEPAPPQLHDPESAASKHWRAQQQAQLIRDGILHPDQLKEPTR